MLSRNVEQEYWAGMLSRNVETFVSPAFEVCQFQLTLPGSWALGSVGYVNIIIEPTKGEKWHLSVKIMNLYSVYFKWPPYPHGKACHPRMNREVNPQMQHAITATKLNRHLERAGKTWSSDVTFGQGPKSCLSQDTRERPTVRAGLGFALICTSIWGRAVTSGEHRK
jgi:hypothetical protein